MTEHNFQICKDLIEEIATWRSFESDRFKINRALGTISIELSPQVYLLYLGELITAGTELSNGSDDNNTTELVFADRSIVRSPRVTGKAWDLPMLNLVMATFQQLFVTVTKQIQHEQSDAAMITKIMHRLAHEDLEEDYDPEDDLLELRDALTREINRDAWIDKIHNQDVLYPFFYEIIRPISQQYDIMNTHSRVCCRSYGNLDEDHDDHL